MKNKCKNCGKCCLETEMILSELDIKLILEQTSLDLKKEDFASKNDDGLYQLKNSNGYCYFFDISNKLCKIYNNRPKGCRFYPLVFNIDDMKCQYDETCPRPSLFYQEKKILELNCRNLKKFINDELHIDY